MTNTISQINNKISVHVVTIDKNIGVMNLLECYKQSK